MHIPAGATEPIPVNRGTIQGDTLSPFLFLIFIELLMRWLHSGGRGYKHGCIPDTANLARICSALAYADDLAILTSDSNDMKRQMEKLTAYLGWSDLDVNASKCAATGVLWRDADSGLITTPLDATLLQRRLDLRIGDKTIPFLHPDKPYTYLGVDLTMTMNWSHQLLRSGGVLLKRLTTSSTHLPPPNSGCKCSRGVFDHM